MESDFGCAIEAQLKMVMTSFMKKVISSLHSKHKQGG